MPLRSRACLLITALGLVLRVAYALVVPDRFTDWTDSRNYLSIAQHLAGSLHFSNSFQPLGEPPVGVSGPTAFREPLYPLFLAAELR